MILDHIGIAVRDFGRSSTFFRRALAPLGIETVLEGEGWAMLGKNGRPEFWFGVHGIPPGPVVGEALSYLLELRIEEGPLGEKEATRRLDQWWAQRESPA